MGQCIRKPNIQEFCLKKCSTCDKEQTYPYRLSNYNIIGVCESCGRMREFNSP